MWSRGCRKSASFLPLAWGGHVNETSDPYSHYRVRAPKHQEPEGCVTLLVTVNQGCSCHVGCNKCMRLLRTNMIINPSLLSSSFILQSSLSLCERRLLKIQPRVSNDVCSRHEAADAAPPLSCAARAWSFASRYIQQNPSPTPTSPPT